MKKKVLIIVAAVVLVLLLIPIPLQLKDGGTKTYNAVLYRVVAWHALVEDAPDGYKTGTEVHLFPKNFKDLSEVK